MPTADAIPGRGGITADFILSSLAKSAPCNGPAPPKAIRSQVRRSIPRSTETLRMPRAIVAVITCNHAPRHPHIHGVRDHLPDAFRRLFGGEPHSLTSLGHGSARSVDIQAKFTAQ